MRLPKTEAAPDDIGLTGAMPSRPPPLPTESLEVQAAKRQTGARSRMKTLKIISR
jgi:hypothetical protein